LSKTGVLPFEVTITPYYLLLPKQLKAVWKVKIYDNEIREGVCPKFRGNVIRGGICSYLLPPEYQGRR
jgi:hypothetical protein